MEFIAKNPALIIIDVQKAFLEKDYPGIKRNNINAELICGKILEKWRELNLNIIHVRHSSTDPNSKLHESKTGFEFNDFVKPKGEEMILTKNVNSAFIGTGLNEILKNLNINTLVIANRFWYIRKLFNTNIVYLKYFITFSKIIFKSR